MKLLTPPKNRYGGLFYLFVFQPTLVAAVGMIFGILGIEVYKFLSIPTNENPNIDRVASADILIDQFENVVFYLDTEYKVRRPNVRKWRSPIRLAVSGEGNEKFESALKDYVKVLTHLTGIDHRIVERSEGKFNLDVRFTFAERFLQEIWAYGTPHPIAEKMVARAACFGIVFGSRTTFSNGLILISTHLRDSSKSRSKSFISSCLLEELTQSLGLPNDTKLIRPSIFSEQDELQALSINDKIIVRTLYDTRIKAGMKKTEAMELARKIIPELVAKAERDGVEALHQPLSKGNQN